MVLGVLTANLNSFHGRQTASVPAYNAVFGANYHITTSCTVDEARKCNTVEDLQKVVMDDEGHMNRFVLEHTEPTDTQPPNSDKYETEGRQYWEDDDDDEDDNDIDDNNEMDISQNYDNLFGEMEDDNDDDKNYPTTPVKSSNVGVDNEFSRTSVSSGIVDETPIVCRQIDEQDSILKSQISPPMATIVHQPENNNMESAVAPQMETLFEESEESLEPPIDVQLEAADDPPMEIIVEEIVLQPAEVIIDEPVEPPMEMILQPPANIINDDESIEPPPEVEVVTTSDIKLTQPKDVKFRKLVHMSECWNDPTLILNWDRKGNRPFKCVKARLNCHDCGIMTCITGYDSIYEQVLVETDIWFDRDFMDAFFALIYHTHHFRSRIAASLISYPEYMWMVYPQEEWKVGVKPTIKTIVHPKSDRLVVLLYHENHFAVMEINFRMKKIHIYDGLDVTGRNLDQWNEHITFVLMTCGQIPLDSQGE